MKTTEKRARTDTAKAAVQAAQNAALPPLEPPACVSLRPADRPFWGRIVSSKARDNWTDVDLVTAAQLARAQADIEALQSLVDSEGYIVDGKINPAAQMLETLSKRTVALTRVLQVHALATVGRSADAVGAAKLEREARAQADDDLIPRLVAVK
ncbi:MAG: TerS protein [Castellaniella sp.]